jgi:uncharacterized protein
MAIVLVSTVSAFTFSGPDKPAKPKPGLLWEISGKGLAHPSYLYGTIHVICPQDLVLIETIRAKLSTTRQLSLESDMDDPNLMAVMMREAVMKDGTRLRTLLTAADYARLAAYFAQKLDQDLQLMETWKPIMLIGQLERKPEGCQPVAYEEILMKMAWEQGKEVVGLETIEALMAIFDQVPYKNQAQMLMESLDSIEENKQRFQQLVSLYQQQDLEGLQKTMKFSPEMEKFSGLNVERNKSWIPVMEQQAQEKPTFLPLVPAIWADPRASFSSCARPAIR